MDLKQQKLTKSEWEFLEIPVDKKEQIILNLIYNGFNNINITKNDALTLLLHMKIGTNDISFHSYLFENYFKKIIDKINYQEIENPYYKIDDIALNTTEIHFYHNMIVIKKKKNLEKSNILINNRRLVGGKNFYKTRIFIKNIKYFLLNIKAKINIFISYIRF